MEISKILSSRVSSIVAMLSRPRVVAAINLVLFLTTLSSFTFLSLFAQISLCSGLIVGSVLIALFAVGGHLVVSMAITGPGLRYDMWPSDTRTNSITTTTTSKSKSSTSINSSSSSNYNSSTIEYKQLSDDDSSDTTSTTTSSFTSCRGIVRIPSCCFRKPIRLTFLSFTALAVLVLYVLACIGLWLRLNTVADIGGNIALPGLLVGATISRSDQGVIRIDANNEHDLWFGQGVAHAQTRLWQLEFQRRLGKGTLSEAVGEGGITPDKLFRTLGVYSAAQAAYDALDPASDVKAALDAYAEGVNAYINAFTPDGTYKNGGHFLPLEFRVLGVTPSPWVPADSLVWSKIMSWDLAGNMDRELTRYKLLVGQNLSVDRISQLVPAFDTTRFPTILSQEDVENYTTTTTISQQEVYTKTLLPSRVEAEIRDLFFSSFSSTASIRNQESVQANPRSNSKNPPAPPSPPISLVQDMTSKARDEVEARMAEYKRKNTIGGILFPYYDYPTTTGTATRPRKGFTLFSASSAPLLVRAVVHLVSAVQTLGFSVISLFVSLGGQSQRNNKNIDPSISSTPTPTTPGGSFRKNRRIGASNNWVVGSNLTANKKPILCNDPHLQLLMPSLWQLTHLSCPNTNTTTCGIETIGASFAGLPGVVIGRNRKASWGVTNTGVDVQDLYIMSDNPLNSSEYQFDGQMLPYTIRQEVIHVAGEDDVIINVRVSRYGPVVTDNGVTDLSNGGSGSDASRNTYYPSLSLRWVSIDPTITDTTFTSFYKLQRISDWTSFREALSYWVAPSQNVVFASLADENDEREADGDGSGGSDFGYQMPGWVPVRNATAGHTGAYPVPGNSSMYDWLADASSPIPYDDMPRTHNPPEGFIVTANNQVQPAGSKLISVDWDAGSDGYRAERIRDALLAYSKSGGSSSSSISSGGEDTDVPTIDTAFTSSATTPTPTSTSISGGGLGGLTVDHMKAVQADTISYLARDISLALNNISISLFTNPSGGGLALRTLLSSQLWDFDCHVGSALATLHADVWQGLSQLGSPETGETYWDDPVFVLNAFLSDGDTKLATQVDPACIAAGFTSCGAFGVSVLESIASKYGITSTTLTSIINNNDINNNNNAETTSTYEYLNTNNDVPLWGVDLHFAVLTHEVFSASPLACIADRKVPHGGDGFTVNVGSFSFTQDKGDPAPYTQTHGSSYRQVIDWSQPEGGGSFFVHPGGTDGAVFSFQGGGSHTLLPQGQYDNLVSLWASGEYLSMSLDATDGDGAGSLVLSPA